MMLELGRYRRPKVPRTERICTICGSEVEDEIHYTLRCMPNFGECKKAHTRRSVKLCEDFLLRTDMEKFYFVINNCYVTSSKDNISNVSVKKIIIVKCVFSES